MTTVSQQAGPSLGDPQKIRVLLYHRVLPASQLTGEKFVVSEENFRRQIDLLDRWGYSTMTFADLRLYEEGRLNLPTKPLIITFDDAYIDIHSHALPIMRSVGMRGVIFALGDLSIRHNAWDDGKDPSSHLLNEQQLLELHGAGFEIGSHSLTHAALPRLDRDNVWHEISRSRMSLEILLNAPVQSFAYPYGAVDDRVKQLVAQAGYDYACAAFSGPPMFGSDPYEIRRILVRDTQSPLIFWMQLQPAYLMYRWLVWLAKRMFRRIFPRKA